MGKLIKNHKIIIFILLGIIMVILLGNIMGITFGKKLSGFLPSHCDSIELEDSHGNVMLITEQNDVKRIYDCLSRVKVKTNFSRQLFFGQGLSIVAGSEGMVFHGNIINISHKAFDYEVIEGEYEEELTLLANEFLQKYGSKN